MTVQEWLGHDNQLGIDIWERKYRYNNESFDEWITRVSGKNIAIAELIKENGREEASQIIGEMFFDKLEKLL